MDASLGGLASLLATIHNLYPQARVTSGYRGPNNPLTLRNPASLHAQGSPEDPRAVDVAPIPGMTFDQYWKSIQNAGVPVAQHFDEAAHPFPWTTGPNWHIATGAPQARPQGNWGLRPDGTPKGNGFLGVLKRPDGGVSTEISVGLPIDGREMDVPTLVPGLTGQERNWLLSTPVNRVAKELPDSIRQKAVTNAMARIGNGQSPFYGNQGPKTLASLVASDYQMPVNIGADPSAMQAPDHPPAAQAFYPPEQQPMTLADLGQSKFPVANGVDPLAPQQRRNPFSVGNILGVLGDSLMAYGGMKPEFGPALERQQEYKIQQDSEDRRTQFNNNLELQRQIALAGWKQAHPDTPEPTEFEKLLMARGYQKGSPEYNKALDSYINYRQSPDQYTNVPGYGLVRIPRSAPDVPTAPVGKLTPL